VEEKFFPPYNCYVIIAGTVSEKQIAYEEKVMREIIKEIGGTFLSADYKADVLYALAPWNVDCIRHVTGYRMNRHFYAGSNILGGPVDTAAKEARKTWKKSLDTFGETYITDRGGIDDTPFLYSENKGGRFWLTEADVYPDATNPELLQRGQALVLSGVVNVIADKFGAGANGLGVSIEPLTSFFPEVGPNAHHFFRKLRAVFDPNNIYVPGRQVFTKTEYDAFPDQILAGLNKMRALHGMPAVEKEK
jgi:hypothetical protein